MISVTLDRRSAKQINDMLAHGEERVARGEQLFLLELIGVLRRAVAGADPKVAGGRKGRKYRYADRLRVGTVEGAARADAAVAIWLERKGQVLKDEDMLCSALLIVPQPQAPAYVRVLAGQGLWPADLLPFQLAPKQARVIARKVRPDEAAALRARILGRQDDIVQQLRQTWAPAFQWGRMAAAGQRVYVDIAWEVLRNEFGWSAAPERAAWRPALKDVMAHVPTALRKFADYLVDGNEARFDTGTADTVTWREVRTGIGFQRTLMPFVKRRV